MFTLEFWGAGYADSGDARKALQSARGKHATLEAAVREAQRVTALLPNPAAHPAIVRGPGLPREGLRC